MRSARVGPSTSSSTSACAPTTAEERGAKFSRDSRRLAYTAPVWSRSGRAVSYLSDDNLISSEFVTNPSIRFEIPRQLAVGDIHASMTATYDVSQN